MLHPLLVDVMADMYTWAVDNELPFVITETVTTAQEDAKLGRTSASHRECRAFDLSSRDWKHDQIVEFVKHFNFKYSDIAAISKFAPVATLVVYHDSGHGPHFHVQIHAKYAKILN
jgi:hypothetical protein